MGQWQESIRNVSGANVNHNTNDHSIINYPFPWVCGICQLSRNHQRKVQVCKSNMDNARKRFDQTLHTIIYIQFAAVLFCGYFPPQVWWMRSVEVKWIRNAQSGWQRKVVWFRPSWHSKLDLTNVDAGVTWYTGNVHLNHLLATCVYIQE